MDFDGVDPFVASCPWGGGASALPAHSSGPVLATQSSLGDAEAIEAIDAAGDAPEDIPSTQPSQQLPVEWTRLAGDPLAPLPSSNAEIFFADLCKEVHGMQLSIEQRFDGCVAQGIKTAMDSARGVMLPIVQSVSQKFDEKLSDMQRQTAEQNRVNERRFENLEAEVRKLAAAVADSDARLRSALASRSN